MELFLSRVGGSHGPLGGAIKHAAEGNRHVVMAMNVQEEGMVEEIRENLPLEIAPFLAPALKANSLCVSLIVGDPAKVEFRAFFRDEAAAKDSMEALQAAAKAGWSGPGKPTMLANSLKGRGGKPGPHFIDELDYISILTGHGNGAGVTPTIGAIGFLNTFQKLIQDSDMRAEGSEITASLVYPSTGEAVVQLFLMASGMTIPAAQTRARQEHDQATAPPPTGVVLPPPLPPGPHDPNIAPKPKGPMPNKGVVELKPNDPKEDKP
jgi:hypothetical protein